MTEEEWPKTDDLELMFEKLGRKASQRKSRLFLVACCRRIIDLIPEGYGRAALEVAEAFADEKVGDRVRQKAQRELAVVPDDDDLATINALYAVLDTTKKTISIRKCDLLATTAAQGHAAQRGKKGSARYIAAFGAEQVCQAALLRDIFGNPFRPITFDPKWRTEAVVGVATKMYDDRDFRAMPILADALEEAGCDSAEVLTHCREPGVHVRGCWVVDLVLGKA